MDAGLAKVLNSTVGKGNITPLDELVNKILLDSRSLVESDEVYATFPDEIARYSNVGNIDICEIKLPHNGAMNLKYNLSYSISNDKVWEHFIVYKNGVLEQDVMMEALTTADDRIYTLRGNAGDVFKIAVSATLKSNNSLITDAHQIWLTLYSLKASVLESRAVEITAL